MHVAVWQEGGFCIMCCISLLAIQVAWGFSCAHDLEHSGSASVFSRCGSLLKVQHCCSHRVIVLPSLMACSALQAS